MRTSGSWPFRGSSITAARATLPATQSTSARVVGKFRCQHGVGSVGNQSRAVTFAISVNVVAYCS
jgi:hypothetical protein